MNVLEKIIQAVFVIGLPTSLKAYRYSKTRDRLNAAYPPPPGDRPVSPGRLVSARHLPNGAAFHFDYADLEICFLHPGLVRLAWNGVSPYSYAVTSSEWADVSVTLQQNRPDWCLSSSALQIRVAETGEIQFLDLAGALLRREQPPSGRGRGWIQSVKLDSQACICGLGERSGRLNLRPGSYRFWNQQKNGSYGPGDDQLYISMPVYLCLQPSGSYLAFYDNTYDGRIELDKSV